MNYDFALVLLVLLALVVIGKPEVIRDDYLGLVMKFPLTSVHSEEELQAAQEVMDALLDPGKLSAGKELYLDALSDLVAAYEDEHYRILPASDAEMLRHLMESRGISQSELQRSTKIRKSTISEILSGKKSFSRQLIRTLADFFNVDKSILAHNL
ncbi:helix-turn-helix domain-containing protein [Gimesia maris]|uniref:helix-turn-helix domain-containing protein n=1 Tax=Gimesia maris TaxID=122 RepID=UPI0032F02294